ncbi:MAG: carbohydrate kinase, partial [Bacteroidota bacterium]|nr:carbohydrate kinase [Bacteroidota bacterium]
PTVIRAGKANMFLSEVFTQSFINATGVPVELHQTDGSLGAALGAGLGLGFYKSEGEAFTNRKALKIVEPSLTKTYEPLYQEWKSLLEKQLQTVEISQTVLHTI